MPMCFPIAATTTIKIKASAASAGKKDIISYRVQDDPFSISRHVKTGEELFCDEDDCCAYTYTIHIHNISSEMVYNNT